MPQRPTLMAPAEPLRYSIVALDRFIQATRDSGYKSTISAISELVDNSVQAEASLIDIKITNDLEEPFPIKLMIRDDGCGMGPDLLRTAMRFGGSSRFGDRSGLGRYGMGLPNSSLSQARRVDVYSWQRSGAPYRTHLDVDQIAAGTVHEVPEPVLAPLPGDELPSPSGTYVVWSTCDRLDNRRVSTLVRKLEVGLGQRFRYHLWNGGRILLNGVPVRAIDPLYLHEDSLLTGGTPYGDEATYEFRVPGTERTSIVRVRFSELPVDEWHDLPNDEKRRLAISNGGGVSVVRAGREVDYGWFLMGGKKRENYDDWWRCEISFSPDLDEAFGITHTKQQIRPSEVLQQELAEDLEATARILNQRVRAAHQHAKVAPKPTPSEVQAGARERSLPPLPSPAESPSGPTIKQLGRRDRALLTAPERREGGAIEYRIVEAVRAEPEFFSVVHEEGRLVLVVNPDHDFYRKVYHPLQQRDDPLAKTFLMQLELVLLAAARAEAALAGDAGEAIKRLRAEWSSVLAAFLGK